MRFMLNGISLYKVDVAIYIEALNKTEATNKVFGLIKGENNDDCSFEITNIERDKKHDSLEDYRVKLKKYFNNFGNRSNV